MGKNHASQYANFGSLPKANAFYFFLLQKIYKKLNLISNIVYQTINIYKRNSELFFIFHK